jgi:Putative metallopeptidase
MRSAFSCLAACLIAVASQASAQPATNPGPAADGTLTVSYAPGADEQSNELGSSLREAGLFDAFGQSVGETVRLPANLSATFRNCGEANAFYDPQKLEIVMCYELITSIGEAERGRSGNDQMVDSAMIGAASFFFLHELGHALVHQLDIPVTGREEDAVDEIATLILLEGDEDGQGAAMLSAAVRKFDDLAAQKKDVGKLAFWDEHSVDAQRMYAIMCMIYGSNPQRYGTLVGEGGLPTPRAQRPHMKPDQAATAS